MHDLPAAKARPDGRAPDLDKLPVSKTEWTIHEAKKVDAPKPTVAHFIAEHDYDIDASADQYSRTPYDFDTMLNVWVLRLLAPSDGYRLVSWEQLEVYLSFSLIREPLGFDPQKTPSPRTMRVQWNDRIDEATRTQLKHAALEIAEEAHDIGVTLADGVMDALEQDDPDELVPEIEQERKEEAYDFQADLIRDVVDYDRDGSVKYDAELFTDATAHMCRLNEFAEQGMERLEKTCDLDDVPTPQTFRRTVRNVERYKMKKDTLPGQTQCRWVAPEHVYEPRMVSGELRDTLEEKWAINPHNPEGEASVWHRRTEKAIEQQVEWLRDQGIIDDGDSFEIRIDFTTHDYNRHSSTDGNVPIGVHYQSYHDTYYAWKELQATIKIDGHAFLIASVNFTRANDKFQCLRYLVDRAEELVNVDTVLADSEFGINKFLQYLDHRGLDYVVRKEMRRPVREKINEEIEGEGGWTDYTITTSGNLNHRETTLVALKKYHKSKVGKKEAECSKADDEEPETTLNDFINGGEGEQLTFEDMEADEGDPASEYFAVLTNKDIESDGIKPEENPIAHDPEKTAWGIGRLYRDRWSVETKFRDRKKRFQPQTRSRDLGYRRYLWMMASLIYNGWVMLNTNVSNSSPIRDAGEIAVKQNTYIDELDRRVFAELDVEIDLHFPDHEFG